MPKKPRYDLIVIGSGPAGEKGAAQAAYWGKNVAIIEKAEHFGGAGINTGTLPSKTLRETALYYSGLRQRGLYGIDYSLRDGLTVEEFMFRKQTVVENEWAIIGRNLNRHHIEVVWGDGSLKDEHTVHVKKHNGDDVDMTAEIILIATGSSPFRPPDVPFDHKMIFDSDSILQMERIPKTLAVIGGGVIGSEYAGIFTALGVEVTLVDGRDRLLPFVDGEIALRLQGQLESLGLHFFFNDRVIPEKLEVHKHHVHLELTSGRHLECDTVLFAAGRTSNVEWMNLSGVGVELGGRGLVSVDANYQTTVPGIYAAGDVIGFPALASTSMEQGRVAMSHAFGLPYKRQLSNTLPLAVYTIPEIAQVGLTEDDCQKEGIPYLVGRSYYDKSPRGQIVGDLAGMLKLVFSPTDKKLLGVHHIGELASELVHIGALVIAEGGTIDTFISAVFNYPTLADSYKYAAYDGLGNWEKWQAASAQPKAKSATKAKTRAKAKA
jgi:NAD(P) transhydrogenase